MWTSIEYINWSEMPEGAVEFSLEDNFFAFSWYNADKKFWSLDKNRWKKDHYPDSRTKYKVADYHPSAKQDKQKFVPAIEKPCIAVISTVIGNVTTVVIPLYIGSELVVVESSDGHDSYPVDHIKFFPLDTGYDSWVRPATELVKDLKSPAVIVASLYTAMQEGRLSVPSF